MFQIKTFVVRLVKSSDDKLGTQQLNGGAFNFIGNDRAQFKLHLATLYLSGIFLRRHGDPIFRRRYHRLDNTKTGKGFADRAVCDTESS